MGCIDGIDTLEYAPPGPHAASVLFKYRYHRYACLTDLHRVGPNAKEKRCIWCDGMMSQGRRRKYCRRVCQRSAHLNFNPQCPESKMYILVQHQNMACVGCGQSFEDFIEKRIKHIRNMQKKGWYKDRGKVSYGLLGYNTGDKSQVDHIVPLHQGGIGLSLNNVQVLCLPCHKAKTARECAL